ncbi:MAG: sigma-70 family RNA polymerase sigma factor [Candidatus Gastranaerophilales bacterium]|nr:sigma-70 family RNA polymerase sigma factor [Candidatus Gastranaerophilales bacterium]
MENEEIIRQIKNGENVKDNMELLYVQNRGFIFEMAKKFFLEAEKDDLMQEGYLALVKAVDGFDVNRGCLFLSYYGYYLEHQFREYVANTQKTIRLPMWLIPLIKKYKYLIDEYEQRGEEITDSEICEKLEISREQLKNLRQALNKLNCFDIDGIIPGTESLTISQLVAAPQDVENDVIDNIVKERIWGIVGGLRENHAYVISEKYRNSKTLVDIGESLGVSKQRVKQIEKRSLEILRKDQELQELAGCAVDQIESKAYRGNLTNFKKYGGSMVEHLAINHLEQEQNAKNIEY